MYQHIVALALAELLVLARHSVMVLMTLGQTEEDWSSRYRLFSRRCFPYEGAIEVLFEDSLKHVVEDEIYVVGGDGTQTPRSSRQLEGSGWLRNLRKSRLMIGIHAAQRRELEDCHRELKSNFSLGHNQCWAVPSGQWSAWVYSLLLLAGYLTWSLTGAPDISTRWWRGSGRWSPTTLWRAYRATLWGHHQIHPL